MMRAVGIVAAIGLLVAGVMLAVLLLVLRPLLMRHLDGRDP